VIRSAYIAPTEFAPSSIDVKRALLTYDRVYLSDPADRDLIPPQSFMAAATGMPAIIGFNMGAVRPLGKSKQYDDEFDQLMDELRIAHRDGCVEVVSTYDLRSSSQFSLGGIIMGDYPLNPQVILWAYRTIAREPSVLTGAIAGDEQLMALSDEQIDDLGVVEARGDISINNDPALPMLESPLSRERLRQKFTLIARARVASTIKSIGYCASKDLVPIFRGRNYNGLIKTFIDRANQTLDCVAGEDSHWNHRQRVLDIAHEEYVDENVLSRMSVNDVLALRSRAWGKQAEARDDFLRAAAELSREPSEQGDFDETVRARIQNYRALAAEVHKQRSVLSFEIKCELLKGAGGGMTALMASSAFSQMQTAIGAGTLLLAGCLWAVDKIQNIKPIYAQLQAAETEFNDNICFGMHDFYRRIADTVGSGNLVS
jgi:hypothetical protein